MRSRPPKSDRAASRSAGRSLTLKAIQQYEPDALSDENLAKIQAEFDKLPAKK